MGKRLRARSQIVVPQASGLHNTLLRLRLESLVAMDRHRNRSRPSKLLVNVVTAPDSIQYPALPLQRLANLSPTDRLHCRFRLTFSLPCFHTTAMIVARPPTSASGVPVTRSVH